MFAQDLLLGILQEHCPALFSVPGPTAQTRLRRNKNIKFRSALFARCLTQVHVSAVVSASGGRKFKRSADKEVL